MRTIYRILSNELFVLFFLGLGLVFTALETITYFGFISKFLIVDSRSFLVVALTLVILNSQNRKKHTGIYNICMKLNLAISPLLVTIYLVMVFLESAHFHNYVFSIWHVQPTNFLYLVFLSLAVAIAHYLSKKRMTFKKPNIYILFPLFLLFLSPVLTVL